MGKQIKLFFVGLFCSWVNKLAVLIFVSRAWAALIATLVWLYINYVLMI